MEQQDVSLKFIGAYYTHSTYDIVDHTFISAINEALSILHENPIIVTDRQF